MVDYDERLIGVLKTFFVLNEGEWFSSSEIVSFIQKNKSLGLGRTVESITTGKIGMLLRRNLFSDLETKEISSTNKGKRYRWTQK